MSESLPHSIQRVPPAEERMAFVSTLAVDGQNGSDLRQYWGVLRKHQWLIGVFCCGVVLTTLIAVLSITPLYTAETTLLIEPKSPQVLNIRQTSPEYLGQEEYSYYKTQYEVLKSRQLAAQVIRDEGLEQSLFVETQEGLVARLLATARTWASGLSSPPQRSRGDELLGIDSALIEEYLEGMLDVHPIKGTRLVTVAISSPDPIISSRVANAHAAAYIRQGLDLHSQTSEQAQHFLEEKLVELKDRVESSEAALNQYRREKGVISLDDKENIVVERLLDLNMRLTEAEAERIALEAQVSLIQQKNYDSLPAVISSPLIQVLREEHARLEGEQANLSKKYTSDYPAMVQLNAQLKETRQRLQKEVNTIVEGVRAAHLAAEKKEAELRAAMEDQKAKTLGLKDAAVKYAILAREVDTNRQLYDSVLQRMKEMGVAAELRTSNVSILDRAASPLKSSHPKMALSLLVSSCIGLLGGVGLAFFYEYLDNTLKTPEEVEQYLQLPNLGAVPDFLSVNSRPHYSDSSKAPLLESRVENEESSPLKKGEFGGKYQRSFLKQSQSPYGMGQRQEARLSQPSFSVVTEAYRSLRASILMTKAGGPPRTILFTSGTNAEGKTATTVNTAVAFAQMGVKILVIDGDLRRPRCHKVLGMAQEPGLTELLTGQLEHQEVIKPTSIENLYFLSSGVAAPDPGELVGSRNMKDTLAALQEEHYDYIFIDSPPVLPVSDALLLSALVDGVIIVVRGQQTPKYIVKEARTRLGYVQARLLGVVLNGIDMESGDYAYSYGRYATYYPPIKEGAEVDL